MTDTAQQRAHMKERFFLVLAEAAMPLKGGPDPELSLEALIEAAGLLKDHLERELEGLRQEQVD
jgi:hypothetical protein